MSTKHLPYRANWQKPLWCFLCWTLSSCSHQPSITAPLPKTSPPSQLQINLRDWGLHHPREIGYLVLGIVHHPQGERLVIYDIRREKPQPKPTTTILHRSPPLKNGIFVIDRFDGDNVNALGGYFSAFARMPSQGSVNINRKSGSDQGLIFNYRVEAKGFAGFWIHLFPTKALREQRSYLDASDIPWITFEVHGSNDAKNGGENFLLKVADKTWEEKEDALPIGPLNQFLPRGRLDKSWQRAWVPLATLPKKIDSQELASLVFAVNKPSHGQLYLRNLAMTNSQDVFSSSEKSKPKASPSSSRAYRQAMWLWETPDLWKSPQRLSEFISFCYSQKITELFLQLPYQAKKEKQLWMIQWDKNRLRPILASLHRAGIRVEALDGDPQLALRENHDRVLATIESVIAYNKTVQPHERFDGIRYDNEAYLLLRFTPLHKEDIFCQYLELLQKAHSLAHGAGISFGADIPFWFDTWNDLGEAAAMFDGRPMSEWIIDAVDNIALMDYRTQAYGPDGVIAHAQDELAYANKKHKTVLIGLETVALPDETIINFERTSGQTGNDQIFVLDNFDGKMVSIHRCDKNGSSCPISSHGPKTNQWLFWPRQIIEVPATKLTFNKKTDKELQQVKEEVIAAMGRFSSFAGFAIHSYESYRGLFTKTIKP